MAGPRKPHRSRPATTPEGRESQLISQAYDLASRQLREGTAAAQVITHFLKAASTREKLEQERLQRENLLLAAKVEEIASRKSMEDLYSKALKAMSLYSGKDTEDEPEEYDD